MSGLAAPRCVLITGASGGLGAALARAYAEPGRTLILHGRDEPRLRAVAADCAARGAVVSIEVLDFSNGVSVQEWAHALGAQSCVDLLIVNAGVTSSIDPGSADESWPAARRVLAVNLDAALATVAGVVPSMRRRRRGQIALISSLSAYHGLPLTPTYSASKAALKAYGEAIRGTLADDGVAVNVVLPGFIASAMSDAFPGPKPFLMSADRAAGIVLRGLARNRARIAFPLPLAVGMWCLSVLPSAVSARTLRALGYGG